VVTLEVAAARADTQIEAGDVPATKDEDREKDEQRVAVVRRRCRCIIVGFAFFVFKVKSSE
jgi:hypothetical protein